MTTARGAAAPTGTGRAVRASAVERRGSRPCRRRGSTDMPRRTALAAAAVLPAVLLLAACSGLPDLTSHRRQGSAPTTEALELAWSTPATQPDWVPADSSRIRWVASTTGGADAAPAAVRLRSDADLPDTCTPLQQETGAAIRAAWAPAAVPADVRRCGNWAVARLDDGYYGWTPVDVPETG